MNWNCEKQRLYFLRDTCFNTENESVMTFCIIEKGNYFFCILHRITYWASLGDDVYVRISLG